MYESPIALHYESTFPELVEKEEQAIVQACINVGVNVDKAELIKALRYDRGQYEKGYADGHAEAIHNWLSLTVNPPQTRGKWLHVDDPDWAGGGKTYCSACHHAYADGAFHEVYEFNFCPHCGADMREAPHV